VTRHYCSRGSEQEELDDDADWQGRPGATEDAAGEQGSGILIARIEEEE